MKKYFNYLGIIAAAAMTLVSCAKEADNFTAEEPIKDGGEFTIVANPATKTTIDGYQTKWAAGDAINLFHAVAGSTDYVDNGKFTIAESDLAAGTFKGALAGELTSGTYDWYAVYPYTSFLKSVDNADEARFYIGCRSDQVQTQTGNNSTAHLSGSNYPLFGKASGVAFDKTPAITLSPIASFIEVVVTNKNEEPLTVSNVTFTAPEGSEIVGNYIIKFDTTPLTITKYSTYVSDEAVLNVSSATALAKDEVARFYLAVKPFATTNGDDIKVSVNGYERTIHTTKDFTFQAGKIKTVNFDYDDVIEPAKTYTLYTGSIVEGDYLIVADDVAMKAAVSSNRFAYNTVSIVSNSITTNDASIVWHIAPSGEYWTIYNEDAAKYAGGNGTKNQGALLDAATGNGAKWTITNGVDPTIVNYGNTLSSVNATLRRNGTYGFACYGSSTGTAPVLYKLDNNADPNPLVTALKSAISDVPAAGVDAEVESDVYTLTDADDSDITVTVDGTIVTDATAADGDVLYSVAANTGSARSGWIKIAVAGGNTVQIDVNQLSGETGKSYTITWNSTNNSKGVSSYTATWTVTADGLTCNMTNWNNNNNGWNYVKCGSKSAASVATIITNTAIPEAIKTVKITIDAVTAANINSIKLYVSDSNTFGSTEEASFEVGTGEKSVTISSPAANKYYKLEFDCKKSGSNGPLTLSQLVFTTE
ncbi:MAG: hypothetical protein IJV32_05385 [Bacteroidales bacterium]|nr:hypothetical protein [Bacteroidales bacterium]